MRIQKIVNNNVVVSRDAQKREVVVMGKGIAYQKRIGDKISKQMIDKIYHLEQPEVLAQFHEYLQLIPAQYFIYAATIKELAEMQLDVPLQETVYLSLADHLFAAAERIEKGLRLGREFYWEVNHFFPLEYQVAKSALEKLKTDYRFELPKEEVVPIALHLCNAQMTQAYQGKHLEIARSLRHIIEIIQEAYQQELDQESPEYMRFITYIRFFIVRMHERKATGQNDLDADFYQLIQQKYSSLLEVVQKISEYLEGKCQVQVSREDKVFLALNLLRLVRIQTQKQPAETGARDEQNME